MGVWKKEVTNCKHCGVQFNEQIKKYPKRALCYPCHKVEYRQHMERKKVDMINFHKMYEQVKISKRTHIHSEVNRRLNACETKEQRQEFFNKRFEEIQNDKLLWEYLNRNTQRSK